MSKVYVSLDGQKSRRIGCISQTGISIYISALAVLIMTFYGMFMKHDFKKSAQYFTYYFNPKDYKDVIKNLPTYELVSAIILAVTACLFIIFLVLSLTSCCCKVSGGIILNLFRFFCMMFLCSLLDFGVYVTCCLLLFADFDIFSGTEGTSVQDCLFTLAVNVQYGVNLTVLITWVFIAIIAPCLLKKPGCCRSLGCWLIAVLVSFGVGNIWIFTNISGWKGETYKGLKYVDDWRCVLYAAVIAIFTALMYFISLVASDREHDCCACACCHKHSKAIY